MIQSAEPDLVMREIDAVIGAIKHREAAQ